MSCAFVVDRTLRVSSIADMTDRHRPLVSSESLGIAARVFLASRALFVVLAVAGAVLARPPEQKIGLAERASGIGRDLASSLQIWDQAWYVAAAERGYGEAGVNTDTGESTKPFFPLLPGAIALGRKLGVPPVVAGVVVSNVAFFLALCVLHSLVSERLGTRVARRSLWVVGLGPFGAVYSMIYPESLFLLGTSLALYYYRQRRLPLASLAAGACALARPNGVAVGLGLVALELTKAFRTGSQRSRHAIAAMGLASASSAALVVWMGLLWRWAGSPLAFLEAKRAWQEVSLGASILDWAPASHSAGRAALLSGSFLAHVVSFGVATVVVVAARRKLAPEWTVVWWPYVVPAVALGAIGIGRYAWTLGTAPAAVAVLSEDERWKGPAQYLGGAMAAVITLGVFAGRIVP